MADQDAHIGFGAQLQKADSNSPPNYISVMGIKSISGPKMARDAKETTDNNSPGAFRTYIGGLIDAGEVSFEGNFLPLDHTQGQEEGGLLAEFDKGSCESKGAWRILLPECDGDPTVSFDFDGILTGTSFEIPMEDTMSFQGTLKVSGRPELTIETN